MKQKVKKCRPETGDRRPESKGLEYCMSCLGFTLIELLASLAVIGMIGMVAGITLGGDDEEDVAYEETLDTMDRIKNAILGENTPHNREIQISGYVADIGGLPDLNDNDQPEGLWAKPENLAVRQYDAEKRIWAGWNGPYIKAPETGFLTDGWGNAFFFVVTTDGSMTVTSLGADTKRGGTGLNEDISFKIKRYHYMAPVGFSFKGLSNDLGISEFRINYPDPETGEIQSPKLDLQSIIAQGVGYASFISDADDNPLIPIGLRSLTAKICHGSCIGNNDDIKLIVFPVQPGMNYLGTIE